MRSGSGSRGMQLAVGVCTEGVTPGMHGMMMCRRCGNLVCEDAFTPSGIHPRSHPLTSWTRPSLSISLPSLPPSIPEIPTAVDCVCNLES